MNMHTKHATRAAILAGLIAWSTTPLWGQAVDSGGTHPDPDVPVDPPVTVKQPPSDAPRRGAGSASGGGPRATYRGASPGQSAGSLNPPENIARPLTDLSPAHKGMPAISSGEAIGQRDRTAGPGFAAPSPRAAVPKPAVDRSEAVERYRERQRRRNSLDSPLTPAELGEVTPARARREGLPVVPPRRERRTAAEAVPREADRAVRPVDRRPEVDRRLPARTPGAQPVNGVDAQAEATRSFRAGQYREAGLQAQRVLVNQPDDPTALQMLAQSQLAGGQFDAAAATLRNFLTLAPPEAWGSLVKDYRQIYNDSAAYTNQLRSLEKAVESGSGDEADLRLLLGYQYGYLGHADHAVSQLDRALSVEARPSEEISRLRDLLAVRNGGAASQPRK